MIINIKNRFKNKATCLAIILQALTIIYSVAQMFGIELPVAKDQIYYVAELIVGLLVMIGVITDPNTNGLSDSERALTYEAPVANVKETGGNE